MRLTALLALAAIACAPESREFTRLDDAGSASADGFDSSTNDTSDDTSDDDTEASEDDDDMSSDDLSDDDDTRASRDAGPEASFPDARAPLPDATLPDTMLPDATLPDAMPPDTMLPDAAPFPDAAPHPDAAPCEDLCSPNETVCTDGMQSSCKATTSGCHAWTAPVACASDLCADETACATCQDQCESGTTECTDGEVRLCAAGSSGCLVWTAPASCGSGLCEDDTRCQDCQDECDADSSECDAGLFTSCVPNSQGCLAWTTAEPCDTGSCANETTCAVCQHECDVGDTSCTSGLLRTCVTNPQGCRVWSAEQACPTGTCVNATTCSSCTGPCCGVSGPCCGVSDRSPCTLVGSSGTGSGYCFDEECVECTQTSDCTSIPGHPACFEANCTNNQCVYTQQSSSTICESGYCEGSTRYAPALCGTLGTCPNPFTESCDNYQCDPNSATCLDSCDDNNDCTGNAVCFNSECVTPPYPNGAPCTDNSECSVVCIEGTCSIRNSVGEPCDGNEDDDCQGTGVECELGTCSAALGGVCTHTGSCQDPWVCQCAGTSTCNIFRCAEQECPPCFGPDSSGQCTVQVDDGWRHKCPISDVCQNGTCQPL